MLQQIQKDNIDTDINPYIYSLILIMYLAIIPYYTGFIFIFHSIYDRCLSDLADVMIVFITELQDKYAT